MKDRFKDRFITGERFQQLADITILTEPIRQFHKSLPTLNIKIALMDGDMHSFTVAGKCIPESVNNARTIFVYTHLVEAFFRELVPQLSKPITLITHNSDHQINESFIPFIENPKISHWYGQNVAINHKKITALPIGLANSQWPHGQLEQFNQVIQHNREKTKMVYMNFAPETNPIERQPIYDLFKNNPLVNVSGGLSYITYLEELATHFFAISPPGNGLDCHRVWECLYLGVIPIVLKNSGMEHFNDLPIALIDDWKQIEKNFLQREFKRISKQPNWIFSEKLDINYWSQRITGTTFAVST